MILLDQAGAGAQHASLVAAPANLSHLVQHAFVQRHASLSAPAVWRVVPEAHANILAVESRDSPHIRFFVVGSRTRFADVNLVGRRATIGIRLELGTLPVITRLPAGDFTDRVVPVSSLTGAAADHLSRFDDDPTESAIIAALFDFVAAAARGCSARYPRSVVRSDTLGKRLVNPLGVARRTFYARLKAEIGLAPRQFHRVERLERALRARTVGVTWGRAAAIAGYADQAHLTREAQRLLGESPGTWSRRNLLPNRSRLRGE